MAKLELPDGLVLGISVWCTHQNKLEEYNVKKFQKGNTEIVVVRQRNASILKVPVHKLLTEEGNEMFPYDDESSDEEDVADEEEKEPDTIEPPHKKATIRGKTKSKTKTNSNRNDVKSKATNKGYVIEMPKSESPLQQDHKKNCTKTKEKPKPKIGIIVWCKHYGELHEYTLKRIQFEKIFYLASTCGANPLKCRMDKLLTEEGREMFPVVEELFPVTEEKVELKKHVEETMNVKANPVTAPNSCASKRKRQN